MNLNFPHLRAVKDAQGKSTGAYECSACEKKFLPNPFKQDEMNTLFQRHKAAIHPEV